MCIALHQNHLLCLVAIYSVPSSIYTTRASSIHDSYVAVPPVVFSIYHCVGWFLSRALTSLRGTTICNWINNVLWWYIVKPCPALPYQDFTPFEVERFSLLSRLSITRAHTSFPRGNLSRRSVPWLPVSFHSVLIGLITYNDLNLSQGTYIIKQEQLARVYRLLTD